MTFLVLFHGILTIVVSGLTYYQFGKAPALSFGIGSLLMGMNFVFLHFAWKRILQKKRVALSASVIVFKYATLGFIIYLVSSHNLLNIGWFLVGVGTVVPTAIATAFYQQRRLVQDTDEKGE
jgi:hypothetical protein